MVHIEVLGYIKGASLTCLREMLTAISDNLMEREGDPTARASLLYDAWTIIGDAASIIHQAEEAPGSDEPPLCANCNGSGEGQHDGTNCRKCGGTGSEREAL